MENEPIELSQKSRNKIHPDRSNLSIHSKVNVELTIGSKGELTAPAKS